MRLTHAIRTLALGTIGLAQSGHAQVAQPAPPVTTVRDWLEGRFVAMARNCLGDKFRLKSKGSAVPSDVLAWTVIQPYLSRAAAVHANTSMSAVLAQPVTFDGRATKPFGTALPVTWPSLLAPTLESGYSDGRRVQDCSTLLTGNADLKVDVPVIRAALGASTSTNKATTNYLYAGRVVSPFAWALGLAGENPDSTPPMSRLGVLLGIWNWYQAHPGAVTRTDIAIRRQVDALTIYSVEGLSQNTLLSGDADVRFGLPFLSGGSSTRGETKYNIVGKVHDYASVILADQGHVWLPGAARVADLARRLVSVAPAADNPTSTDGQAFRYAIVVQDMFRSMCDAARWTPTLAVQNFTAQPTDGGGCRFQGDITPGQSTGATFALSFGVESVVPTTSLKLVFAAASASLTDERALLSLDLLQSPDPKLASADATSSVPLTMSFAVVERGDAHAVALLRNDSRLRLSCGGATAVPVQVERFPISRDASDQATLVLTVAAPASAFASVGSETATRCQVDGGVVLRRRLRGGTGAQSIQLPSIAFDVVRERAPNTGLGAGRPGQARTPDLNELRAVQGSTSSDGAA